MYLRVVSVKQRLYGLVPVRLTLCSINSKTPSDRSDETLSLTVDMKVTCSRIQLFNAQNTCGIKYQNQLKSIWKLRSILKTVTTHLVQNNFWKPLFLLITKLELVWQIYTLTILQSYFNRISSYKLEYFWKVRQKHFEKNYFELPFSRPLRKTWNDVRLEIFVNNCSVTSRKSKWFILGNIHWHGLLEMK